MEETTSRELAHTTNSVPQTEFKILLLPKSILRRILSFLNKPIDFLRVRATSKEFKDLFNTYFPHDNPFMLKALPFRLLEKVLQEQSHMFMELVDRKEFFKKLANSKPLFYLFTSPKKLKFKIEAEMLDYSNLDTIKRLNKVFSSIKEYNLRNICYTQALLLSKLNLNTDIKTQMNAYISFVIKLGKILEGKKVTLSKDELKHIGEPLELIAKEAYYDDRTKIFDTIYMSILTYLEDDRLKKRKKEITPEGWLEKLLTNIINNVSKDYVSVVVKYICDSEKLFNVITPVLLQAILKRDPEELIPVFDRLLETIYNPFVHIERLPIGEKWEFLKNYIGSILRYKPEYIYLFLENITNNKEMGLIPVEELILHVPSLVPVISAKGGTEGISINKYEFLFAAHKAKQTTPTNKNNKSLLNITPLQLLKGLEINYYSLEEIKKIELFNNKEIDRFFSPGMHVECLAKHEETREILKNLLLKILAENKETIKISYKSFATAIEIYLQYFHDKESVFLQDFFSRYDEQIRNRLINSFSPSGIKTLCKCNESIKNYISANPQGEMSDAKVCLILSGFYGNNVSAVTQELNNINDTSLISIAYGEKSEYLQSDELQVKLLLTFTRIRRKNELSFYYSEDNFRLLLSKIRAVVSNKNIKSATEQDFRVASLFPLNDCVDEILQHSDIKTLNTERFRDLIRDRVGLAKVGISDPTVEPKLYDILVEVNEELKLAKDSYQAIFNIREPILTTHPAEPPAKRGQRTPLAETTGEDFQEKRKRKLQGADGVENDHNKKRATKKNNLKSRKT